MSDRASASDRQAGHLQLYLGTNGARGHIMDFTAAGGGPQATCLILRTLGRRSGEPRLSPLLYGQDGERLVIVASKEGAASHPAWFLNLEANPEIGVQIGDKKYRGLAHIEKGSERRRLFDFMVKSYPPYVDYQARTQRQIPIVTIELQSQVDQL
jgi:deazaflavin-dependent oxidoreductase (nitroreductase family)